MEIQREIASAISRSTVATAYPVGIAGLTLFGVALQDWVYITAIIVAVLNAVYISAKLVQMICGWQKKPAPRPTVPPDR